MPKSTFAQALARETRHLSPRDRDAVSWLVERGRLCLASAPRADWRAVSDKLMTLAPETPRWARELAAKAAVEAGPSLAPAPLAVAA